MSMPSINPWVKQPAHHSDVLAENFSEGGGGNRLPKRMTP